MRNYCLIGIVFWFYKMKKVMGMDGTEECTTMRMYLTLLNCTLKNG